MTRLVAMRTSPLQGAVHECERRTEPSPPPLVPSIKCYSSSLHIFLLLSSMHTCRSTKCEDKCIIERLWVAFSIRRHAAEDNAKFAISSKGRSGPIEALGEYWEYCEYENPPGLLRWILLRLENNRSKESWRGSTKGIDKSHITRAMTITGSNKQEHNTNVTPAFIPIDTPLGWLLARRLGFGPAKERHGYLIAPSRLIIINPTLRLLHFVRDVRRLHIRSGEKTPRYRRELRSSEEHNMRMRNGVMNRRGAPPTHASNLTPNA